MTFHDLEKFSDKILSMPKIYWIMIIILFIICFCITSVPTSSIKKNNHNIKTQTKHIDNSKLRFNIIIRGEGTITILDKNYEVNELKDFDMMIPENSVIKISWKSDNDKPMDICLTSREKLVGTKCFKKQWNSKQGDVSLLVGSSTCFIMSIGTIGGLIFIK